MRQFGENASDFENVLIACAGRRILLVHGSRRCKHLRERKQGAPLFLVERPLSLRRRGRLAWSGWEIARM